MPYDATRDEYYWGYSPKSDGSDYDPSIKSPKLSDAFRVLNRHVKHPDRTRLQMVVVGRIQYKSGGPYIQGYTANITFGSLEATATSVGLTGGAVKHGGGGFSTEEKISALIGLPGIEKVTGIYFRILD